MPDRVGGEILRMVSGRVALALTSVCALASGCSSPPFSNGSTTDPAATTSVAGTAVRATGFTTIIPAGWNNRVDDANETQRFASGGRVAFLVEAPPPGQLERGVNDVTANINVLVLPFSIPADQLVAYLRSVASEGASNVSGAHSFTIDGATGEAITYDRDVQGTPAQSQDMMVSHAGSTYHIVLNTSKFAFVQQRSALDAVLSSWRWTH